MCQSPSERLANHSGVHMASQNLDAEAGRIVRPTQATHCPAVPSWSEAQPTRAQADGACFCLQGRLVAELRVPHVLCAAPSRRPPARAAAGPEDGERGPVLSGESWSVPTRAPHWPVYEGHQVMAALGDRTCTDLPPVGSMPAFPPWL